jgi:hypothetical protein
MSIRLQRATRILRSQMTPRRFAVDRVMHFRSFTVQFCRFRFRPQGHLPGDPLALWFCQCNPALCFNPCGLSREIKGIKSARPNSNLLSASCVHGFQLRSLSSPLRGCVCCCSRLFHRALAWSLMCTTTTTGATTRTCLCSRSAPNCCRNWLRCFVRLF